MFHSHVTYRYLPPCLDALKQKFKTITPVPEYTMVNTLTTLLSLLLTQENTPDGELKIFIVWLEGVMVVVMVVAVVVVSRCTVCVCVGGGGGGGS
jgi:hypothetical protein